MQEGSSRRATPRRSGRPGARHCAGLPTNALVRQQGYTLAQIVVEIHAPDLAVGNCMGDGRVQMWGVLGSRGWGGASGDDDEISAHHYAGDADLFGD